MSLALKKRVQKEVRQAGRAGLVEPQAFGVLVDYIKEIGEDQCEDAVHRVLKIAVQDGKPAEMITAHQMQEAVSRLKGQEMPMDMVSVINVFDVPKILYDPIQRKFHLDTEPRSQLADAEAKHKLYLDRLQLITQRMRRHKMFEQQHLVMPDASAALGAQLSDLQSLRGVVGQTRIVLGCISQTEDGRYVLEDMTGSVPLDVSSAQTTAGFFAENCVVIAEGELRHDGAFHARALGFPPTEPREELALSGQRLNFFGGPALSPDEAEAVLVEEVGRGEQRIVVMANVWLDKPHVLDNLGTVLAGFQDCASPPAMFVLMGDFNSRSCASADADYGAIRDNFAALAKLIDDFPRLKRDCKWVFVPGPGDPGLSRLLPQPPLAQFFTSELRAVLPDAVFGTNPCRIRFYSHQVVLFRQDLLQRMRRRCLLPPRDGGAADMFGHLALTQLQQSHLCPLPLVHQPIYWQYDHGLHLYPVPHALVMADCSPQAQHTHQDCVALNPGSFADGFFAAYVPLTRAVEMSEIPGASGGLADDAADEEAGARDDQMEEDQIEEDGDGDDDEMAAMMHAAGTRADYDYNDDDDDNVDAGGGHGGGGGEALMLGGDDRDAVPSTEPDGGSLEAARRQEEEEEEEEEGGLQQQQQQQQQQTRRERDSDVSGAGQRMEEDGAGDGEDDRDGREREHADGTPL